jgi:hypothetical protein
VNHSDVRNHMADYLEGDLALERRALFDAHLDECPECSDEIGAMRSTIALLRELPDPEAPAQLANDVMRRIRNGEARAGWLDRLRDVSASLLDPRVLAPTSAAMLALGIVLGTGQFRIGGPQPIGEQTIATYPGAGVVSQTPVLAQRGSVPLAGSRIADGRSGSPIPGDDLVGVSVRIRRWQGAPGPVGGGAPSPSAPGHQYFGEGQPGQSSYVAMRGEPTAELPLLAQDGVWTADQWLDHAVQDPAAFAANLSDIRGTTLAEHELWVKNLARRAVESGRLDQIVAALQRSPSPSARSLAQDFAAEARKVASARQGDSSGFAD